MQKSYKADYLYYAGGSALNIVANTRIVDSGLFKDVFIPPATNDSGLSLGAAAYLAWHRGEKLTRLHFPRYFSYIGLQPGLPGPEPERLFRQQV